MSVADDFNRADGGFGANWTTIAGTWAIASNQGTESGAGAAAPPVATKWVGNTWNNDQTSQLTRITANNYFGPAVRLAGTTQGTLNGYVYLSHGSLQRYDNGVNTAILNAGVIGVNDAFSVEIVGSTLNVKVNGVSQGTIFDGTYASGSAGIGAYQNALTTFDDWLGIGEISASPFFTTVGARHVRGRR